MNAQKNKKAKKQNLTAPKTDKKYNCIICGEEEANSKSKEIWIQCIECLNWMHELCAPGDICDLCA